MPNDAALVPTAGLPATAPAGLSSRLAALPPRTRLLAGFGVAALLAVLVTMTLVLREGEQKVLFAHLGEADGAAVMSKLDQLNVPYRFAEGSGTIMVPAARVYELRMKLSAAGVNKGSITGYELLDGSGFGQSDGQQRVQLKRALEGELARTIQSLQSVHSARVMLGLPQVNGFFREQQKPTASVTVSLHPGRSLERDQLAGIVHLVASSVPEMQNKAVSVIDGKGALLWPQEDTAALGFDAQQLRYLREVESAHLKRVVELIEPVVGRDNLRATVTAEVDFSQVESTAEEFKPNQGDQPATVQASRSEENSQAEPPKPAGVPGAATNQPAAQTAAPVNGAAQPLQGAQQGGAAQQQSRRQETNYAVDKTVRVTRNATGTVRRLHAAVVVNHRMVPDAKGKPQPTALNEQELEKLTSLVQQGIGFNAQRGDSVRVVNAPFVAEPVTPAEPVPFYMLPWVQELARAWAAPAALALVALVIVFALIRPAVKAATVPPSAAAEDSLGGKLDAVVAGDEALPVGGPDAGLAALEPPKNEKLEAARQLARQNPAAVANIMRGWVSGETA
jgi:flagellar M-ring protein FliF